MILLQFSTYPSFVKIDQVIFLKKKTKKNLDAITEVQFLYEMCHGCPNVNTPSRHWCSDFETTSAFNSLWPNDAIWGHRSGSTLAQVMACCLMAPSHYLNQFTNVDLSSLRSNEICLRAISQEISYPSITYVSSNITYLRFQSNLPGANELNHLYKHNRWDKWQEMVSLCSLILLIDRCADRDQRPTFSLFSEPRWRRCWHSRGC